MCSIFVVTPLLTMQIKVLLNSKHAFPGENIKLTNLLSGIPSTAVIAILCSVNAGVYHKGEYLDDQLLLLDEVFLQRQPPAIALNLISNLKNAVEASSSKNAYTSHSIFAPWPLLKFIEHELSENREPDKSFTDTTPELELRILKAIFLFNENIDKKLHTLIVEPKHKDEVFYAYIWPALFFQYNLTEKSNYFYDFMKGVILFLELSKTEYKNSVENFLKKSKYPNIQTYLIQYMNIANYFWQDNRNSVFSKVGISIKQNEEIRQLVELSTINIGECCNLAEDSINFNALRSKPFFKLTNDLHLVFHWDFISKKLYDGLLFDFIEFSKNNGQPINLPNFKSRFSDTVIENKLFRSIVKNAFETKYRSVYFPCNDGESDAYFMIGNSLFILEFKDSYFKSETIENPTLENIKEEIESKICSVKGFNSNKNKGVGQLLASISKLESLDWFKTQKYKPSKLRMQPVIVVTDKFFTLPGVNKYCADIFQTQAQITYNNCNLLEDLLILDFEFLFTHGVSIQQKKIDFKGIVENYTKYLRAQEKKVKSQRGEIRNVELTFLSFNEYCGLQKIEERNSAFVQNLFDIFDLTYGLPTDSQN